MDMSETYIKMCDCLEIQEQCKPTEGDWIAFCGDIKTIADYEIWALEKKELSDIECWNEVVVSIGGHFVDHWNEARECFVFLPRQDQIQEIVGKDWINTFESFDEWYFNKSYPGETYPNDVFTSMEQLWLAFYMYEKHKKKWSGGKWVK